MLRLHLGMHRGSAEERALEILELVGLGGNRRVLSSYPHELSGGMKQRVMIGIAICCNPSLLIADEPTTALDVTLQLQILRLIMKLRSRLDMGILFISHDLAVVHDISEQGFGYLRRAYSREREPGGYFRAAPPSLYEAAARLRPGRREAREKTYDHSRQGSGCRAFPDRMRFSSALPLAERGAGLSSRGGSPRRRSQCIHVSVLSKEWTRMSGFVEIDKLVKTFGGRGLGKAGSRSFTAVDSVSLSIEKTRSSAWSESPAAGRRHCRGPSSTWTLRLTVMLE